MQRLEIINSPYFRKLLTMISLIMLVSHGGTFYLLSERLGNSLFDREVANLKDKLVLLEPRALLALKENRDLDLAHIFPEKDNLSNVRYSVIARRGEMIADSHALSETVASGFELPEVVRAMNSQFGVVKRSSEIFQGDIIAVALVIRSGGVVLGALKADYPVAIMRAELFQVQKQISIIFLVGYFILFVTIFFLAKRVTQPVKRMAEVCEAMTKGNYRVKIASNSNDELGVLARMLNRLGEDLSERVSTALAEKAKLKAMLQSLKEGIIAIDSESRILFTNQSMYQLLNSDELDCRGQTLANAKGCLFLKGIAEDVLRQKIPIHEEKEEGDKTIHISATPFAADDVTGAVLVLQDRTEIRKLEAIRRDFVANVSHELKTPLTAIKGYVETLLEYGFSDPKTAGTFLDRIAVNTDRLTVLVTDILALSKLDSAQSMLETHPCDWGFVIKKVLDRQESAITEKKLKLRLNLPSSPVLVEGDMEALGQVFENLLTNAIRYTPGGGSIDVNLKAAPSEVTLQVCDTGLGIPTKEQERIFERFYRVDRARSREGGGTGLGLSIVKHLVSEMGGKIALESYPGRGSRFFVTLRRAF